MEALKSIMEDFGLMVPMDSRVNAKRPLELTDEDQIFCESIQNEETFDIDYSGVDIASMTESLRDTNMLDCE
jgi:hypothetical protein